MHRLSGEELHRNPGRAVPWRAQLLALCLPGEPYASVPDPITVTVTATAMSPLLCEWGAVRGRSQMNPGPPEVQYVL